MKKTVIYKCKGGHFFLEEACPFCDEEVVNEFEIREGDCVACGQLCPDGAYACNTPSPIDKYRM